MTKAAEELEFFAKEIASGAVVVEVPVDVKFHRQIVGRQGSNVAKLQTDSGIVCEHCECCMTMVFIELFVSFCLRFSAF